MPKLEEVERLVTFPGIFPSEGLAGDNRWRLGADESALILPGTSKGTIQCTSGGKLAAAARSKVSMRADGTATCVILLARRTGARQ